MNPAEEKQEKCLLCGRVDSEFFFEDKFRRYFRCVNCNLIFVPTEFHVTLESEKARYEEHNNDPDDEGYRNFLGRIVEPIERRFKEGSHGLDFGCGPTPLLAQILTERGFEMEVYDPFYATDLQVLTRKYDFVVTTEVVEHLKNPLAVFKNLFSLTGHDGMLAVMTRPYDQFVDFKTWHYKNDRTHICFFSTETFDWLSMFFGEKYAREANDIFIFDRRLN